MRRRLIGSILVCLFSASIFAARFSANSPGLRVNESATKFSLQKAVAVVSLAIENSHSSALAARIKLELIDPRDVVRATAMIDVSVPSGSSVSPAPQEAGKEAKYAIRAHTLHPLTGKPVPGVNVEARMVYKEDDKERDLKSSGVTNSNGEALLEFKLPGPLKVEDVEIKVAARRDGFLQEAGEEVSLLYPNQVLISTDKPLYQPGQT